MDTSWDDLRLLAAALDEGSLTAAARRLGVGQATMSRRIAALEARLGHVLFERSRKGIRLTPAGERLLPHLEKMSAAARGLTATAESLDHEPRGTVKIAVPPGVAADVIAPAIPELRAAFPHLRVAVVASPRVQDLEAGEADLAVRFIRPTSGDLVSVRLGRSTFAMHASPALLREIPSDMDYRDLPYINWPAGSPYPGSRWLEAHVPDVDPVFIADDFLVQRAAAHLGIGVMISGPSDTLEAVGIPHPPMPSLDVYLVARRSLASVPRVRVLMDYVVQSARRLLPSDSKP